LDWIKEDKRLRKNYKDSKEIEIKIKIETNTKRVTNQDKTVTRAIQSMTETVINTSDPTNVTDLNNVDS